MFRESALSMQYTSQRACSVQKKQVVPTSPSSPLRDAAEHNNESLLRSLAISRTTVLQRGRLEIWGRMQPAHQLKPFSKASAKQTVFLTWRSTLATISFYISLYISSALDYELGHIKSHVAAAAAPSALGALVPRSSAALCTYHAYIYFILRSLRQIELNAAFWHTFRPLVFSSWL